MLKRVLSFLVGCSLPPAAIVVASMSVAGRSGIEKAVTRFFQPDGFFWALLSGCLVMSLLERRRLESPNSKADESLAGASSTPSSSGGRAVSPTAMLLLLWIVYTVAGSPFLAEWLNARLEAPFVRLRPLEAETVYDRVIVLGGSTETGGNGESALSDAGDRVMLTARLFHTGKAKRLVVTGLPIQGLSRPSDPTPAEQTIEMLVDLGVPRDSIDVIGGRTTSEEMRELKKLLKGQPERLGLVTSAWHMGRAMRLAKAAGLEIAPLPADFRSGDEAVTPLWWIPKSAAAEETGAAIKEIVSAWIGR